MEKKPEPRINYWGRRGGKRSSEQRGTPSPGEALCQEKQRLQRGPTQRREAGQHAARNCDLDLGMLKQKPQRRRQKRKKQEARQTAQEDRTAGSQKGRRGVNQKPIIIK